MKAANQDIKFYRRGNQYWKQNENGEVLLINTKAPNQHYDGSGHIFLKPNQFSQTGAIGITQREFNTVRNKHLKRLTEF